jgi:arsenate reductase
MAEGFARALAPAGVRVFSAGTNPAGMNARAVAVMAEAGVDIAGQRSKDLSALPLGEIDTVVALCGEAAESCPALARPVEQLHWPLRDPARARGSEEEVLQIFREVRDEIGARVRSLFARA